jgi:hypothetical protein
MFRQQGRAQQQFEQAVHEGQLLQEAQREFEALAAEAYHSYLTALAETSAANAAAERGADAYEDMLRSTASGQGAFGQAVQDAYQELISTLGASAGAQPTAATDSAEPYQRFGTRLNDAWKQAQELQAHSAQAYGAYVAAWQESAQQRQRDFGAAYDAYIANLKEAYARSDYERRSVDAAKEYAVAAEAVWKQTQQSYSDAVIALVNASKGIVDSAPQPGAAG